MTRAELEQQLEAPPTWAEVERLCRTEGIRHAPERIKLRRLNAMIDAQLAEQKRLLGQQDSKPGSDAWWIVQEQLTNSFKTFDILTEIFDERAQAPK